jgi:hypothetical protein
MKNTKKSLGNLRPVNQPSEKHPRMLGTIKLQRHTLRVLAKQMQESQSYEIICNLAAWINQGFDGKFFTIELSPRPIGKPQKSSAESYPLADLLDEDEDDSESDVPSWLLDK